MKTQNDRPSNHKGAPDQNTRKASEPGGTIQVGGKDAKPTAGDRPGAVTDPRPNTPQPQATGVAPATGAGNKASSSHSSSPAKTGAPRQDDGRKST